MKKGQTFGTVPKPQWAEAFMVLLLAKTGGSVSLSLEQLEEFSKLSGGDTTELSYDEEAEMVTLNLLVKAKKAKKSKILVPEKRIII